MKKLLLLLPFAALMAACSKHNDAKPALTPQTATTANVEGKWLVAADTSFSVQNEQTTFTIQASGNQFFTYNSNGTGVVTNSTGAATATLTYTVSGGVIKQMVIISGSTTSEEFDFNILAISPSRIVIKEVNGTNSYTDAAFVKQ